MANIKLLYRNILENSTVNPTNESSVFPKYRAYDRDIGKLFKASTGASSNFMITIDQGASASNTIYPCNRLIIPTGHNLSTIGCILQYSSDNFVADINSATSWTATAAGINKTFGPYTQRYWRLNICGSTTFFPEIPEMFLGQDYTFQANPAYGSAVGEVFNVARAETQSGKVRLAQLGEIRKSFSYNFQVLATTQKEDLETCVAHTKGAKPVWMIDDAGTLSYVEILNDSLDFPRRAYGYYSCVINFREVL